MKFRAFAIVGMPVVGLGLASLLVRSPQVLMSRAVTFHFEINTRGVGFWPAATWSSLQADASLVLSCKHAKKVRLHDALLPGVEKKAALTRQFKATPPLQNLVSCLPAAFISSKLAYA